MPPPSDPDAGPYGPPVDDSETLLRVITPGALGSWIKSDGSASSLMFDPPKFSTNMESLTSVEDTLRRWPEGSRAAAFGAGVARTLGFFAHHEPEDDNHAHANVYCTFGSSQRKKAARALAALTRVLPAPV